MSEATVIEPTVDLPSGSLILLSRAIDRGVDADQVGKLVDLYRTMEADKSRVAYNAAMNNAQREMPRIVRVKQNTQTQSKYAPLEAVNELVVPVYSKWGFSLEFSEGTAVKEGDVRVICKCNHADGHTREHFGDFGLDVAGIKGSVNKTAVQAKGSTFTYGRRYLTCMIFNVSIADEDNDGNQPDPGLSEEEVAFIKGLIREREVDEAKFIAWACDGLPKEHHAVENMAHKMYGPAVNFLKKKPARTVQRD